jgi:ATP-binding cassette subfamily F protein uup
LLDRANFSLERGERVCVVGRNGEGKSTLLKVVEGVHLPDSGDDRASGRSGAGQSAAGSCR